MVHCERWGQGQQKSVSLAEKRRTMRMKNVVSEVMAKRKQSVSLVQKNMLSIDLLLQLGDKTMLSAEEIEALKRQKAEHHADMLSIEEDDKEDEEALERRRRFQADEKVSIIYTVVLVMFVFRLLIDT